MARITIELDTADLEGMQLMAKGLLSMTSRDVVDPTMEDTVRDSAPVLSVPVVSEHMAGLYAPLPPEHDNDTEAVPAPPLPTTPLPEPPAADTGCDSEGIPWDARIHATTRTKRQNDMTWKLKRGVSEELVTQVKGELRGGAVAPDVADIADSEPPTMPGQSEYQMLMQEVTRRYQAGNLSMQNVEVACTNAGLAFPKDLANRPELVAQVAAELGVELCQS